MNVLLNFSTLKKGGGQNVGLNFLHSLDKMDLQNLHFYYVVVRNSEIHKFIRKEGYNEFVIMPRNPILRILKEFLFGKHIIKKFRIDIVYTYFGSGFFPRSVPQIGGCANSNLYFPEIDFWSDYSGLKKIHRKIIDRYRIWGLKRVQGVIYENEIMRQRSGELFKITNTILIKPSIIQTEQFIHYKLPYNVAAKKHKGLFFCGWQRNKNFMIIPLLASELRKIGIDFHFILTAAEDDSADHQAFLRLVARYDVRDMVSVIGRVNKNEIRSLYEQIDFVFLLSKLESFSNNIIEAWFYERPLIVSDEFWSRSICKDAAIYVSRNDVHDIINKLTPYLEDGTLKKEILQNGLEVLSEYPTIEQKTKQEIDYLKYIYQNA